MLLARMLALLALSAFVACARAACDACVAGRCHARRRLLAGFPVTDQLAIDRTHNILYLQLNHNQNIAIYLDDGQHQLINVKSTTGMVFVENSQTLYLGTKDGIYYKYDQQHNQTESMTMRVDDIRTNLMGALKNIIIFMETYTNNTSSFFFTPTDGSIWFEKYPFNYLISDFIIDERTLYFVSNNTLYVHDGNLIYSASYPPPSSRAILSKKNLILSDNGEYDWIYIGSATEKLIYKLNKITQEFAIHAGYKTGAIKDFVFGKNGGIVFRDEDGSIVQWVPTPQNCVVEPPHDNFFVRETTRV